MNTQQPIWLTKKQYLVQQIPATISCWLFDSGSLTARVIAACKGRFHVEVVAQRWHRTRRDEARRLGIPMHQKALIREVYLYCDDTPWVFARSVLPHRTLTGKQKFLSRWGARSLGAVLFADPHMRRDALEVARLTAGHTLYQQAMQRSPLQSPVIWGRRSVFYLDKKPLLVSEIFLPTIAQCKVMT